MAPLDSTYTTPTDRSSSSGVARLGASLQIKGEIRGNEDLTIDGIVEGHVHLEGHKLTVGTGARLTADIIAGEVVAYGSVRGDVRAKGRIEIKKDGSLIGDLTTAQIVIEDGAYFKGSIEIDKAGEGMDSKEKSAARTRTNGVVSTNVASAV